MLNRDDVQSAIIARYTQDLRKQLIFSDTTPYGVLDIPPYRNGATLGRWSLRWQPEQRMVTGYYSGLQPLRNNWILTERRLGRERIWMSVAPMELESQGYHAAHAIGHVAIIGFGMGVLAYNVMRRPQVTKVTILERDPAVLRMAEKVMGWREWEGAEKTAIVHLPWQHALAAVEVEHRGPVDVLLADPWPVLGDMAIRADMQAMIQKFDPALITGWGVEFDFISWVKDRKGTPIPEAGAWDEYSREMFNGRLIVPGENPEYWAFLAVSQQAFSAAAA